MKNTVNEEALLFDEDNAIQINELGIQLECLGDKILVVIDAYKSGYECKECGGKGRVKSALIQDAERNCDACKGVGSLLVIPETAKSLPTLGIVVSCGEKTEWIELKQKYEDGYLGEEEFEHRKRRIKIRPGAKVLFEPYVGTLIPFKGNIRLKVMRVHEPLTAIYGVGVDSKDFIDFEMPLESRY